MPAPTLRIDHVTIAGSNLDALRQKFAAIGLTPDYGGPHSNGLTHMALLGLADGSYIELISWLKPGHKDTAFWGEQIAADAGPCAWAVQVDDVAAESARLAGLGIAVDGPAYYQRRRPDGVLVEWDLAFVGNQGAGAKLPFIIKDITPRSHRVQPSPGMVGGPLRGVGAVVLGVQDLAQSAALFQRLYGWPAPATFSDADFGAALAWFARTPVILATPLQPDNWLARRLARFGELPCAYLLAAADFSAACARLAAGPVSRWAGTALAWLAPEKLTNIKLGVIGGETD